MIQGPGAPRATRPGYDPGPGTTARLHAHRESVSRGIPLILAEQGRAVTPVDVPLDDLGEGHEPRKTIRVCQRLATRHLGCVIIMLAQRLQGSE